MVKNINRIFKVISLCLLLFVSYANAQTNYLLATDAVIDPRAKAKINLMGSEVFKKTGVNIYVHAKKTFGITKDISTKEKIQEIKKYESIIVKQLKEPYILLTFALDEIHVNLLSSKEYLKVIDKNEILNSYVVPLLASKDKNSLYAKVSAAVLNGYDEIADQVIEYKGVEELQSGIGDSGRTFSAIWKVIMYSLVLFGIIAYTIIVLRSKKIKK